MSTTDPTTIPDPELSHGAEYIGRVRTGGGGFLNPIDEPVTIQPSDILVKIPDGPWFARYQRIAPIDAPEPAAEPTPEPDSAPAEEETQAPADQ